ncbi:NAD(P)-binding protein [Macrolepiota fuliginosa MF-IS2]|uniref:NAD(P)-binding protein n=1 Tax=Macrolepiota fuliginosa MF-IS2 TaxID=1400762 RepID=A0A9P5XFJ4_9AGAR|nr:NAD(P)-binding protein [Macrolepiota fuliginosa MF-IS2]
MPSLSAIKAANAEYQPSYLPVAVVVGGTAGIGKCTAQLLAHLLNGRVHIVIVGRNEAAARAIIATMPNPPDGVTSDEERYEFIPCDVTSMKNIHHLADTLRERLPKINYLILSAGGFSVKRWEETEDELDKKLASRYYSRWALTNDLLPLLRKAQGVGEDAKVMSILGAGQASAVDVEDLGLKKSFTGLKAMMRSIPYNDLMMAEFAERNPEISFIHIYPGFVDTAALAIDHWLATLFYPLIRLFAWVMAVKPEICAEYMVYAILDSKQGLSRRNEKGDDIGDQNFPSAEGAQKKLWEHTVEATKSTVM